MNQVNITLLVEDTTQAAGMSAEHGLSLWIESGDKRILFDTGQTDLFLQNAKLLGIDPACADAIVISHGHYDHTGGLLPVLKIASNAGIYLHPAATGPKYSRKASQSKYIGMSDSAMEAAKRHKIVWTSAPVQIFPGITVTGQVPRINDYEDVGGAFYTDEQCREPDDLLDDQALFIESSKGIIVVLGCGHAGVVNTLDYVGRLTGKKTIYGVTGGMHLLNASRTRIADTIEALKKYRVEKIVPLHCTGSKAIQSLKEAFGDKCLFSSAGGKIEL